MLAARAADIDRHARQMRQLARVERRADLAGESRQHAIIIL
jgi:hypothetical protein